MAYEAILDCSKVDCDDTKENVEAGNKEQWEDLTFGEGEKKGEANTGEEEGEAKMLGGLPSTIRSTVVDFLRWSQGGASLKFKAGQLDARQVEPHMGLLISKTKPEATGCLQAQS